MMKARILTGALLAALIVPSLSFAAENGGEGGAGSWLKLVFYVINFAAFLIVIFYYAGPSTSEYFKERSRLIRSDLERLEAGQRDALELAERASRVLCEGNLATLFATFVCGKAGTGGEIELCNAGHCPVLLLSRGEVTRLAATGVPLGMFCSVQYSSQKTRLEKGDALFLYTDGLTEARSASDEEYGEERLMKLIKASVSPDPSSLIRACTEDLAAFLANDPLADDLTIMVIRRVD